MIVIIVIVGAALVYCLIVGIVQYIHKPKPPPGLTYKAYFSYYQNKEWLIEDQKEETPFYIADKLAAYDSQIESYNNMLELLNIEYGNETDNIKQAAIRKKQADLMLKLATIEEKAYKLRETLE